MHRPTRKSNILDLIFCPNELINSIVVSDTFISDHRMITVETNIPVHGVAPKQISNPPSNQFAVLDLHKADSPNILLSFQSIYWVDTLEPIPPSSCFYYFIDTLYHKCMYLVPTKKNPSKTKISKFHRERKMLMRKRTKLRKMSSTKSITQLIKIEQAICDSHLREKLNEESIAVAKIKSDPNFFFRYALKISICKNDIEPIKKKNTQLLVNKRLEICSLLLDQFNSVFTSPITNMIVHDTVVFFSCQSLNPDECLTDIEITEQIIIDSIQGLSSSSAAGPDSVPSSVVVVVRLSVHVHFNIGFSPRAEFPDSVRQSAP